LSREHRTGLGSPMIARSIATGRSGRSAHTGPHTLTAKLVARKALERVGVSSLARTVFLPPCHLLVSTVMDSDGTRADGMCLRPGTRSPAAEALPTENMPTVWPVPTIAARRPQDG